MATNAEVSAKLDAITSVVDKVSNETSTLLQEIEDLKDAAEGNVPDDIVEKIDALAERIKAVDDLVSDAAEPEEE